MAIGVQRIYRGAALVLSDGFFQLGFGRILEYCTH
jgi:hypothetical protein